MSVWYAIPSARPDGGTIPLWVEKGYNVIAFRELGAPELDGISYMEGEYPGYAEAVNKLCRAGLVIQPDIEWIVTGGDDIAPDDRDPEDIARECTEHFGGTFGVMQPTGDRWAGGSIDRICGSPWMGADFCRRMYGGEGPLWPGWFHCFVDEELQAVAQRLGVLWQRPDLTHLHQHWARRPGPHDVDFNPAFEPAHLKDKNPTLHRDRPLFGERKAAGFPGHEPVMEHV